MPWRQVNVMTERFQFIRDARQRLVTFTELCVLYGISADLPVISGCDGPSRAGSISCRSCRGTVTRFD
jgi:hypothetical protein